MKYLNLLFFIIAFPLLAAGLLIVGIGQIITGRVPHFAIFGYQVRETRALVEGERFKKMDKEAEFLKRISEGVIRGEIKPQIRHEEVKAEESPIEKEEVKAEESPIVKETKKRVRRSKAEIEAAKEAPQAEAPQAETAQATEDEF